MTHRADIWSCKKGKASGIVVKSAVAAAALCAAAPVSAGAAVSGGGTTIAAAPTVAFGSQFFGNDATAPAGPYGGHYEFFKLPLVAGDAITIDWEEQASTGVELQLFPSSTNDFNFKDAKPTSWQKIGGSGLRRNEFKVSATQTEAVVLAFDDVDYDPSAFCSPCATGTPGAYDFTVNVKHAVVLFLPARATLPRQSTYTVGAHAPDGTPINDAGLRITLLGIWQGASHRLGTASIVSGAAAFHLKLPVTLRGKKISLRAQAAGSNYTATLSLARTVTVR